MKKTIYNYDVLTVKIRTDADTIDEHTIKQNMKTIHTTIVQTTDPLGPATTQQTAKQAPA